MTAETPADGKDETKTESAVEPVVDKPVAGAAEAEAGKEALASGAEALGDKGGEAPGGKKPAEAPDWREARLRVETAKRREAEARVRELEARQVAKPPVEDSAGKAARYTDDDVNRLADQKAAMQSQWRAFSDACDATAAQGRRDFTDFDSRVGELRRLVDQNDVESQGAYNRFLAAAMETGEAAKILHALGGDLNEAQRIMSLAPVKMGVEMAKLAMGQGKEFSKAPKPINAINSRGSARVEISPDDAERADNLSTAEWMKRREAQVKERDARR